MAGGQLQLLPDKSRPVRGDAINPQPGQMPGTGRLIHRPHKAPQTSPVYPLHQISIPRPVVSQIQSVESGGTRSRNQGVEFRLWERASESMSIRKMQHPHQWQRRPDRTEELKIKGDDHDLGQWQEPFFQFALESRHDGGPGLEFNQEVFARWNRGQHLRQNRHFFSDKSRAPPAPRVELTYRRQIQLARLGVVPGRASESVVVQKHDVPVTREPYINLDRISLLRQAQRNRREGIFGCLM